MDFQNEKKLKNSFILAEKMIEFFGVDTGSRLVDLTGMSFSLLFCIKKKKKTGEEEEV